MSLGVFEELLEVVFWKQGIPNIKKANTKNEYDNIYNCKNRDKVYRTLFSLGSGTDISLEAYDNFVIYIGAYGTGLFDVGTDNNCKL